MDRQLHDGLHGFSELRPIQLAEINLTDDRRAIFSQISASCVSASCVSASCACQSERFIGLGVREAEDERARERDSEGRRKVWVRALHVVGYRVGPLPTRTHARTRTNVRTHARTRTNVRTHARIHTNVRTFVRARARVRVFKGPEESGVLYQM